MPIIDRVKNILLKPKEEWLVINTETATPQSLLFNYVIPLSLIPAIARFIGYGLIGFDVLTVQVAGINWGIMMAVQSFFGSVVAYYMAAYIIDGLAANFLSEKNVNKSAQLVAYSMTAGWVAGIFLIIPSLSALAIIGLYGVYLFYVGLPLLKKTPDDKIGVYMIVGALAVVVTTIIVNWIFLEIVYAIFGNPYSSAINSWLNI
jgi:hypothetical protein